MLVSGLRSGASAEAEETLQQPAAAWLQEAGRTGRGPQPTTQETRKSLENVQCLGQARSIHIQSRKIKPRRGRSWAKRGVSTFNRAKSNPAEAVHGPSAKYPHSIVENQTPPRPYTGQARSIHIQSRKIKLHRGRSWAKRGIRTASKPQESSGPRFSISGVLFPSVLEAQLAAWGVQV